MALGSQGCDLRDLSFGDKPPLPNTFDWMKHASERTTAKTVKPTMHNAKHVNQRGANWQTVATFI